MSTNQSNKQPKPKPHWAPPNPKTIKVNADASFCPNTNFVGLIVVGRDSSETWVGASLHFIHCSSVLMA